MAGLGEREMLAFLSAVLVIIFTSIYLVYKKYVIAGVMCPCQGRVDGKTIIITGASSGIGRETALELARRGGRVILACRNIKRATAAAATIQSLTGSTEVFVKHLDLASVDSIHKFAQSIHDSGSDVDILINNAAVSKDKYAKTEDGYEYTFAVNYLGPFLLTNLLLDLLVKAEAARVVNVAAHTHVFGHIDFSDLMMEQGYSAFRAYCQSKLALICFSRELAKRLEDTNVKTYAVHPGMTFTKLRHRFSPVKMLFLPYLCRSPKEGAQTTIYCAVAHEVEADSGWYYSNCDISTPIPDAFDDELGKRLWEVTANMLRLDKDRHH